MTNTVWYSCLSAIGFVIAALIIYKERRNYKLSTLLVYFLFTTCISWIGEFIVLGFFDSYAYKPGIAADQWAENLAGHLFLNASMFPAVALLISIYSMKYLWGVLIIIFFLLVEYLFEKLGIYEQHWWKYYMSTINVIAFMLIAKKWFEKIKHPQYNISRLLTFYFICMLIIHTPMPFLLLWGKQHYSLELVNRIVGNIYRSSIIFIFTYHLIEAAFMVYFICVLEKWYWKLAPYVIGIVVQSALAKMNILIFTEGWKLIYTIIIHIVCITIFILVEKHTLKPE